MAIASQPQNFCNVTGEGNRFHDIETLQQSASRSSRLRTIGLLEIQNPECPFRIIFFRSLFCTHYIDHNHSIIQNGGFCRAYR